MSTIVVVTVLDGGGGGVTDGAGGAGAGPRPPGRAPWLPPAPPASPDGGGRYGVYSLFPPAPPTAHRVASSSATHAYHKVSESLFSTAGNFSVGALGAPTPPPGSPYSPLQLDLLGSYSNHNSTSTTNILIEQQGMHTTTFQAAKKTEEAKFIRQQCYNSNTICCDMQTEDTRSWDNRTTDVITTTMQPLTIKTENIITTSKKSCNSCVVESPAKKMPHFLNDGSLISNGGCSRTNPVSWTTTVPSMGGALVQVKREPHSVDSHQGMLPIKLEQNSPSAKQTGDMNSHQSVATSIAGSINNGTIPVGIAVARQRLPHELGGGGGMLPAPLPPSSKDQLPRFPDMDAVGGSLAVLGAVGEGEVPPPPWPLPQHQAPPPAAWQYPPQVAVESCVGVGGGLQLVRDPGSGGLQLVRDPGSGGLQLVRDPGSSIQLLRDPGPAGLQLVRDPSSGALLLLPPAYLQPPASAPPPAPLQPQHMHDMWQEQFQQAVVWGGYGGVGAGVLLPPLPPPLAPLQLLGAELLTASTTLHHHTTHQTHHSTRLVALAAEPKPRPPPPPPPHHPRDQGFLLYQLDCRDRPASPGTPPPPNLPDVQDASNQTDTPTPSEEEELNSNHAAECASEDVKHIIIPRSLQEHMDSRSDIRITTVGDNNIQITPMLYADSAVQTKKEPKTPVAEHFDSLPECDVESPVIDSPLDETDKDSHTPVILREGTPLNNNEETEDADTSNADTAVTTESESQPEATSNIGLAVNLSVNGEQESAPEPSQKPDPAPLPQIKVFETIHLQKPSIQVDLSGLELLSNSIEQFETRSKNMESSPSKPILHMPSLTDHISSTSTLSVDVKTSLHPPPVIVIKTSPKSPKPVPELESSRFNFPPTKLFQSNICDENNSLGGLGLLCALAEQRFMEEEEERRSEHGSASTASTAEENTQEEIILSNIKIEKHDKYYADNLLKAKDEYAKTKQDSLKQKPSPFQKTAPDQKRISLEQDFKKEFGSIKHKTFDREDRERFHNLEKYKEVLSAMRTSAERKSFDKQRKDQNNDVRLLNKRRLSEKSRGSSTSTVDPSDLLESLDKNYIKFGKCDCKEGETHTCKERAKWLSSMNAMEIDMINRLADLKRQYKEKQRELNKLVPKKSPEDPFKRGPGRPRKKSTASDRATTPPSVMPNSLNFRIKPASGIFISSLNSHTVAEDSSKTSDRISSLVKLSEDENSNLNDGNLRSISPIADSNSSQSSIATISSSKKRKVGRPKKLLSTPGSHIATETIVAKKPKSKSSLVGYLLAAKSRLNLPTSKGGIIYSKTNPPRPCEEESSPKKLSTKNYKGLKLKTNLKPSENNCYSSPASSISEYKYPLGYDVKQKYASLLSNDSNAGSKMRPKLKAEPKLKEYSEEDDVNNDWCGSQSNLTDIKSQSSSMESLQEVHLKNKQKTDQLALKHKKNIVPKASCGKKKRDLKDLYDTSDSENEKSPKKRRMSKHADLKVPSGDKESSTGKIVQEKSAKKNIRDDYDASESENNEKTKQEKKSCNVEGIAVKVDTTDVLGKTIDRGRCTLALDDLGGGDVRVLTAMGGLFYAGSLRAVRAPDVYAVTLDGERGNRPHILSREEALRDAILEVFPASTSELLPGTRLCAYWSQQYRCLYPGTVAEPSTPDPLTDHKFVSVEFDDGDSGRIALEDIRLLQPDYPIVEYDLNPLLTLSKRRRQTSVNSTEDKKGNTFNSSATSAELNNSVHQPPKVGSGLDTFVSTSEQSQLEAEFSHRERKRLKKHKKEKLKKILSRSGDENSNIDDLVRKRKKKHKCCDDHCKHRKHHKKHHRKHKRHHHSSSKEHSGSSSEDPTRSAMLATAFNQSPFFAIKDVSVNLSNSLDSTNMTTTSKSTSDSSEDVAPKVGVTKTIIKKRPIKILKKTLLTKATKMNKGKKITVTDVVEQNGCLEFATNSGTGGSGEHVLVKKIKITSANGKKTEKENLKDSGIGVDSNELIPNDDSEDDEESDSAFNGSNDADTKKVIKKTKKRSSSSTSECGGGSKMAAFLPAGAQLWGWRGPGHRRPQARGRARKCFYRAIQRGTEVINVGDSAVFLSTGRPDRPYIGQVESLWEGWQGGMAVRVRWYYHPEETIGCPGSLASPGGLFESPHTDENDVQTISHRCEVLSLAQYKCRLSTQPQKCDSNDTYYLAGHYDPTHQTLRMEPDIPFVTE